MHPKLFALTQNFLMQKSVLQIAFFFINFISSLVID